MARRPHPRKGASRARKPDRRQPPAHRRRRGLQGPQRRRTKQAQGLHLRPKARRNPICQTRPHTARRRRTGHRSSQGRPPNGTKLPSPQVWRRQQRRPRRYWIQLPPPELAEAFAAPKLVRSISPDLRGSERRRCLSGVLHGRLIEPIRSERALAYRDQMGSSDPDKKAFYPARSIRPGRKGL